jgi:3-methyladenine DNA glycosylase AlkD
LDTTLKGDRAIAHEKLSASMIHREMKGRTDSAHAAVAIRFFKCAPGQYGAGDRFLGIRVPILRKLAATYQALPLPEVSRLLKSRWHEERLLALLILVRQYRRATPAARAAIHRFYMRHRRGINSWDLVDCSAEHIVGAHLRDGKRRRLLSLARSAVVWDRRIAIIATFYFVKRGDFDDTLRIALMLRDDPHDLIHKAVGWMLREVGKRSRAVEEAFLRQHAAQMPRTMLRYAIEHFPERLRRRYLAA